MNLEAKKKTNFGSFGVGGKVLFAFALGGFLKARFSTTSCALRLSVHRALVVKSYSEQSGPFSTPISNPDIVNSQ